jgi:hypothetical protein
MKILCPNCKQYLKLPDLEGAGVQMEKCGKCGALVHASYEQKEGGRKIWDIHFEKPPEAKKKEPPPKDGCLTLLFLILAAILAVALYRAWWDGGLDIIRIIRNIIRING